MHSFLSKVFGRKKEDKETSPTTLAPGELLDGRFEAVSPNVSPSANHFLELDPPKTTNGQEIGFSLFRGKSRPSSPEVNQRKLDNLPHLSLNFRETKEELASRQLGFLSDTDLDTQGLLSDAVIGQRRLNPLEALVLIQACSKAITTRGLETLGIMHPHWYSSSADVQRRIISRYINSLNLQNSDTIASPSSLTSPTSLFESEIHFTRSPHDIAAVLRWGLRHLQIEGDSFGTDDGWYKAFLDAEAAAEYPPKAFSEKLAPHLPPAHLDLLTATLEIFSSLAAHAEANSTSGSKLSKMFGLWLLTARRVEDKDDWSSFYARWERTGRMLEHIFLARIRDESVDQRMPVRLLELVRTYPYTRGLSSPTTDLPLLPRPRFTTPVFDALFVRIEIEFPKASLKPKSKMHPLNLLADAFSTQVTEGEFAELWAKITAASKDGSNPSPLSNIFADETIRFLSIIPDGRAAKSQDAKSPTFTLLQTSPMKKSSSEGNQEPPVASTSQHKRVMSEPVVSTPISPLVISDIGSDWAQFSSSGFLDSTPAIGPLVSTLFDTDIEKTVPPNPVSLSRKSSKRMKGSRKSIEVPRLSISENGVLGTAQAADVPPQEAKPVVKASKLEIVQFDEAFIDFWSDSLLDPLTSTWPTFIICKFKSTLVPTLLYGPVVEGSSQKTLKWLILEQVYTVKAPPPPPPAPVVSPVVVSTPAPETARPASPSFSVSGKKRFNFWSVSRTGSSSSVNSQKGKKRDNSPKVGEMGELIEEEVKEEVKPQASVSKGKKVEEQKPVAEEAPVRTKVEESKVQEAPVVEAKAEVAVTAAAAVAATAAVATAAVVSTSAEEAVTSEEPAVVEETNGTAPASELPSVNGAASAQTEEIVAPKEEIPVVEETGADKEPAADVVAAAVDEVVPAEQIEAKESTLAPEPEQTAQAAPPVAEVEPPVENIGVETEATAVVEGVAEEEVTPKDEVKDEVPSQAQPSEPIVDASETHAVVEEQAPTEAVEIQEVVPETAEHVVDVVPAAEDVSPDIPAVVEAENMTNVAEEVVEESSIPITESAVIESESAPSHDVEVAVESAADVLEESKTRDLPVISQSGEEESVSPSGAPVVLESVPETISAEISSKDIVDETPVARDESLQSGAVEESAAAVDVGNIEPMEIVHQSETAEPVVEPATVEDESSQAAETPSVVESIPEDVAPTVEEEVIAPVEESSATDIATSEPAINQVAIIESSGEEPASGTEILSAEDNVEDGAPPSVEVVAEDIAPEVEPKSTVIEAVTEPIPENVFEGTVESVDAPEPEPTPEDVTESEPIVASVVEDEVHLSEPVVADAAVSEVETTRNITTNESNIAEPAVAWSLAETVTMVEIPPAEEPATALEERSIEPEGKVVTEPDSVDVPEVVAIEPSTEPAVEAEDTKPETLSAEVVDNPSTREPTTVVESVEERPVPIQPETVVQPVVESETAVVHSESLAEVEGEQANNIVEPNLADTAAVGNVVPGADGVTVEIPSGSITESTSHHESISDSIPTNTGAQVISNDEIVLTSTEDTTAPALPISDVEPQLTNTDQIIEHLTEETPATANGNLEHSEDVKHDDAELDEITVVEHSADVQNSVTASPRSVEVTETHVTPTSTDQGLTAARDASFEEVEQDEIIPETRDEQLASTIDEPQIELPPTERDEDVPSQSSALEKSIAIEKTPMVAEDLGEIVLESTLAQDENSIAVEVSSAITEEIIPESIQPADPIPVLAVEEPIVENSAVEQAAVEESSEPVDEKIAESNIVNAVVEEATEHSTLNLKEPTVDEVAVEEPSIESEQSIVEPTVEEPSAESVIEKTTIDEQNAEVVDELKIAEPIVEAPIIEVSTTETVETLTNEEPSVENLVAEPHEEVTIVEDQAIEEPVETSVEEFPVENVAVEELDEKVIVETPIIEESSIQRHEDHTQTAPLDSVEIAAEVNPAVAKTIVDEPTVTEPIVSETIVDESSTAFETSTTEPTTVESATEPAAQPLVVPSVEELAAVERPESVPEAVAAESALHDEQVIEQPVESSMHQEIDDQPSLEQVTIEDAGIEQFPPQEVLAVLDEPIQEEPAVESQDAVLEEPVVEAPVVLAEKIVEESVTDEPAVVNRIIEEEGAVEMIPTSTTIPAIADISSADAEEGDQDKTDDVLARNTSSVNETVVPTEPIVEASTIPASVQEEELESQIPELANEEKTQDVIHEALLEESVEPPPMASEEHIQDAQVESAPLDEIIPEPIVLNDEQIEQPVILAESQEDVREVPIPAPVSDNTEEGQQQLEDATFREAEAIDVSTTVVSEPELSDAPIETMLSQEGVSSSVVDEAKADEEVKTEEISIEPPAVEGHAIEEPITEAKPVSEDFLSGAMDTSANTDQDVENVGVDAISAPSAEEVQPAAGETILDVDSIESTGVIVEELPVETLQDSSTSPLPIQEEMPVSDALETEASEKNVEDRSDSIAPTTIISEEPTVVNDEVVEPPANQNEPHSVEVQESVPEIVEEPVSSAVDNTAGEVDSILVDVAQPRENEKPVIVAASTLVEPTREPSSEPPAVILENNADVAGEASSSAEQTVEQLSVEAPATEEPVVDDKVITEPSLEEDVTNVVDAPVAVTAENAPDEQDIPTEDESINVAAEESVVENVEDTARLPVQESPVVPDILDKEETSEVVKEPILVESTGPETIVSEEPVEENVSAALVEETQAASAVSDVLEKEEADAVVEDIIPSDSTHPATIANEEPIQTAVVEPALVDEEQVAASNGDATIATVDEQVPISPEETTTDVIQDHPDEVQMEEVDDEQEKERILPEELVEIPASKISSEPPVNVEPPTETPLANISEPSIEEIPAAEAPLVQVTMDSVAVTNEHSISEPSEEVSVEEAASSVVDAPVASPENVAEDVEISSSVPQEVKPSVEESSSQPAVVVADEPVIETVEDAPTAPLSIQEEVPVVPDVLEKEAAAETVDERIPSDSITPVTIVSDEPVEEFAPAPALVEEEVVAESNGEVVIATTEEQPAISVEEAVNSTHLGEEPVSPHVEEVVEDTVEESAPSEAVVDVPTNDDINRPTPVDVAPAQTETPLASVSESVVENTPTIDAPSVEVAPLESDIVTDDISAVDPGEAASVEVPAIAEHPIEVLPVEAEEQAAPVVEEPTAEDIASSDVIAPESLANGETMAPENAEQIISRSDELAEDANVVAAEVEVETEASNGNGNGSGTHHGTMEIHKIEIPDIIHRSVSENIGSSVLSPWSDDNTQVGDLLSPLSPTTLVDEVLSVPVDLASKIENLVAGGNGHEIAPPEESSATSKDLDVHTPAPIEVIHTATINTEEPTTL